MPSTSRSSTPRPTSRTTRASTPSTVTVEATAPAASSFKATAISGAGGSSVGVAGSIAVNVVVANTTSDLQGASPVTLNGADLTLSATSNLDNQALATAKQAADGSASGVGASVAVNVVNDTTTAGLPDGSVLVGAKNLTITSTGTDSMTTTANGGASAGSGSLALSAQVAITISNITTSATVGTGPDLTLTGGLTAHATQNATTKTTATGATKGGTAGIGLSLALDAANHLVDSQLKRNLASAGTVAFTADGLSSNDTEAKASSAGAEGKSGCGDESKDSSGKDVNRRQTRTSVSGTTSRPPRAARTPGRRARRRHRAAKAAAPR